MLHLEHAIASWLLVLAPGDAGDPPRPSLAVAPMAQIGEPQNADAVDPVRIEDAIMQGLARGELELDRLEGKCEAPTCWVVHARQRGHERVLLPTLESLGPDYQVRIDVMDVGSGKVLTSTNDTCEICGEDEIAAMASDVAAGLLSRLSRLGPGGREQLEVDLEPLPPAKPLEPEPRPARRKALLATGASLVAGGVVGVATGAGLFALDGRPYRQGCGPELVDVNGRCPQMYEASAPAVVMVVAGGTAVIAGVALLVHVLRERSRGSRSTGIAIRPSVSGLTLGLRLPVLRNRRIGG